MAHELLPGTELENLVVDGIAALFQKSVEVVLAGCLISGLRDQIRGEPLIEVRAFGLFYVLEVIGRGALRYCLVAARSQHDDVGKAVNLSSVRIALLLQVVTWKEMMELLGVRPRQGLGGIDVLSREQINRCGIRQ